MPILRSIGLAAKRLFRRQTTLHEIDEELAFHIDMETEKNISGGLSPQEARRQALVAFGGKESVRQKTQNAHGAQFLANLLTDLRYATRVLAKRRIFSLSVLAIVSICIAANTAFFAAFESLALKPLPFPQQDRLVEIFRNDTQNGNAKLGGNLSLLHEYKEQTDLFESVAFFSSHWMNFSADGHSSRLNALSVSPDFFKTLGLPATAGSLIDRNTSPHSAVLSHSLWESSFAASPDIIGKTILMNGIPFQVIGVAAPGSEKTTSWAQIFLNIDPIQLATDPADESLRSANEGTIWARLQDSTTPSDATTALTSLEQRFASRATDSYQRANAPSRIELKLNSVHAERTQWARQRLTLLLAISIAVLLIGLSNTAHLFLSQLNSRIHEYWTRRTLGASPLRLLQQILVETFLLISTSCLAGILLGFYLTQLIAQDSSTLFGLSEPILIGSSTLTYIALLALISSLAIGSLVGLKSLSALRNYTGSPSERSSTEAPSSTRLHSLLFIGQTALTLSLLIALGLLGKSFYNIITQDLGFDDTNIVSARIHLPDSNFDNTQREAFKENLLLTLATNPAFESAALSSTIPSYGYPERRIVFHDPKHSETFSSTRAAISHISEDYLATMGIRLLQGRNLDASDTFGWQTPILVDSRFAERYFPQTSPIGQRINLGTTPRNPNNWPVIVGVVESAKQEFLDDTQPLPLIYFPLKQSWNNEFSVFVKSRQPPDTSLANIRQAVETLDPMLPTFRSGPLSDLIGQSLAARQGILTLGLGLGIVAIILAILGTYGSVAFRISQRLRELSIRLAIGATEEKLIQQNLAFDLRRSLLGIAAGLTLATLLSKFLTNWLFEVAPIDATTYLSTVFFLLLITLIASYLPLKQTLSRSQLRL